MCEVYTNVVVLIHPESVDIPKMLWSEVPCEGLRRRTDPKLLYCTRNLSKAGRDQRPRALVAKRQQTYAPMTVDHAQRPPSGKDDAADRSSSSIVGVMLSSSFEISVSVVPVVSDILILQQCNLGMRMMISQ